MLNVSQALIMQSASGGCAFSVSEVIYGWGTYSNDFSSLPLFERAKIEKIADLIVTSFALVGCSPYREVEIVGHADKDWHGDSLEVKVSHERADTIKNALTMLVKKLWDDRKMGPPPPGGVAWETKWKGAREMTSGPYHNENRRVEITIRPAGPLVPLPDTLPI